MTKSLFILFICYMKCVRPLKSASCPEFAQSRPYLKFTKVSRKIDIARNMAKVNTKAAAPKVVKAKATTIKKAAPKKASSKKVVGKKAPTETKTGARKANPNKKQATTHMRLNSRGGLHAADQVREYVHEVFIFP